MITDLAVCEWNAGHNRSIQPIEIAAKHVPIEDQSLLVQKFNQRKWDDLIVIKKASISGTAQYESDISNMNFGTKGFCKRITRARWQKQDVVYAIVFWINGHSYGYASVCGNLFSINRIPEPTIVAPIPSSEGIPIPTIPAADSKTFVESSVPVPDIPALGSDDISGNAVFPGIPFSPVSGPVFIQPIYPVPPVPEPSTWLIILFGFGILSQRIRSIRGTTKRINS